MCKSDAAAVNCAVKENQMKIIKVLFLKKFDYVAFPIGLSALLMFLVNLFYETGLDSFMLWNQVFMVFLYYWATRGRAEKNLKKNGIEPIILLSFFGFLVVLTFLANIISFWTD